MRVLITFLLSFGVVGCAATKERDATIEKRMNQRYDFFALTEFLKKIVEEHPSVEGVSIASTKISPRWRIEKIDPPSRMRGGDWVIWEQRESDEAFDLYYMFDSTHSVTARVKRLTRDSFELQSLTIEDWISLK